MMEGENKAYPNISISKAAVSEYQNIDQFYVCSFNYNIHQKYKYVFSFGTFLLHL